MSLRFYEGFARQEYNRELTQAYRREGMLLPDPDFATLSDSEIYEKARRDAVLAFCMRYRQHLVAGQRWSVEPFDPDDPLDQKAAEIAERGCRAISNFTESRMRLANAVIRGSSFAFIEGGRREMTMRGDIRRTWWVPRRLVDVDRYRFAMEVSDSDDGRLKTIWKLWSITRAKWENLTRPELFIRVVYDAAEASLFHGRGALEAMYLYHYLKTQVITLAGKGLERWALGILYAKLDRAGLTEKGRPNTTVIDEWRTVLEKHRTHHVLVMDKEDDMGVLTGGAEGWQLIRSMLDYLDQSLCRFLLGAVLPTGGDQGIGSLARAQIEENSTASFIAFDRELLAEALTDSLIRLFWNQNQAALAEIIVDGRPLTDANLPQFTIAQDKAPDPNQAATKIATLLGAGVPVVKADIYEQCGLSQPGEEDEVIEAAPAPAAPPGLGGFGFQRSADELIEQVVARLRGLPGNGSAVFR